jgi:hypothetical protein
MVEEPRISTLRFSQIDRFLTGEMFTKHKHRRSHKRWIRISPDEKSIIWSKKIGGTPKGQMEISTISEISDGNGTKKPGFTIKGDTNTLSVSCDSREQKEAWMKYFDEAFRNYFLASIETSRKHSASLRSQSLSYNVQPVKESPTPSPTSSVELSTTELKENSSIFDTSSISAVRPFGASTGEKEEVNASSVTRISSPKAA